MDTDRARENCRRNFIWRVRMCNKLCNFGSGRSPSAHNLNLFLWALGDRPLPFIKDRLASA